MHSMTGYASRTGAAHLSEAHLDWEWDLRSVNGRGLEIRMRLPETVAFIEKPLRDRLMASLSRGNVSLNLRLRATHSDADAQIDMTALDGLLRMLGSIQTRARSAGVTVQAPTALELLSWRGILPHGPDLAAVSPEVLAARLTEDFEALLGDFLDSRAQEGAALAAILLGQLDEIARLTTGARNLLDQRSQDLRAQFERALAQVLSNSRADPTRAEQELALLAVKADLTEELDRLDAHCATGRALLDQSGPVGRKLDFLTQEFNREANTLCSKAQHLEMARIGLDLKTVIDQIREQVQNVE
ncbi:MAG: YicC/YloC family endoribonuclease [Roseinatronobacter sp.]